MLSDNPLSRLVSVLLNNASFLNPAMSNLRENVTIHADKPIMKKHVFSRYSEKSENIIGLDSYILNSFSNLDPI